MEIIVKPISRLKNTRILAHGDFWGNTISEIELEMDIPTKIFDGIGSFSHLEIIFYFNETTHPVKF